MSTEKLRITNLTLEVPGRRLLDGFTLSVDPGHAVAIMGASGTGKSTLLQTIAGIRTAHEGEILIEGTNIGELSANGRAKFRLNNIGLVFQFGDLLPELNVLSNVSLPLQLAGMRRKHAEEDASAALAKVGMENSAERNIDDLSGGENQRVAIARAVVSKPRLILADEPTGALDEANSIMVAELLLNQARNENAALIVATHDPLVASRMDRIVNLRDFQPKPVQQLLRAN